jgi:hypothetical protein
MACKVIEYDEFDLIIGENAISIFDHFGVWIMHGLSKQDAVKRISEGGTYIDGLCNEHPTDLNAKPFIFLNLNSCDVPCYKLMALIMHETMHMSDHIYNGCWDSDEENMITWAENTAIDIYEKLFL